MAKYTHPTSGVKTVENKDDIHPIISNISPAKRPVTMMMKQGKATSVKIEHLTDADEPPQDGGLEMGGTGGLIQWSYTYTGYALNQDNMVNPLYGDGNSMTPDNPNWWDQAGGGWNAVWEHTWVIYNDGLGDPSAVDADATLGDTTVYRLKEGIERFFITDINNPAGSAQSQSELPVMWDGAHWFGDDYAPSIIGTAAFNHIPGGANVLYMDGHVTFVRYPGEFPLNSSYVIKK